MVKLLSFLLLQLIFLAGSTDVSKEDISALLSRSNTTVSVYTYSLMGESVNSSSDAKKKRSVQRLKEMAQTTNGKFEVKFETHGRWKLTCDQALLVPFFCRGEGRKKSKCIRGPFSPLPVHRISDSPEKKRKPDRRLGGIRSFVRHKRMLAGLIYPSFVMLHFFSPLLYHTCALMFSCVSFRALQTIASWRLGWDGFTKISEAKAHKIEGLV